ncbi:MAG: CotH kinase family protein [Clostridia bacterium]|nr:CotH kinase family protein [Clostridia bacterium]
MKKLSLILSLTAALICMMLLFSISAIAADELPFTDVKKTAWYYENVKAVYNSGIMEGKSDGIFAPNDSVTRAEFVTIMARLAKADTESCREHINNFTDAKKNAWYADAMGWGVKTGLVNGTAADKLSPNKPISRAEIATLISRLADHLGIILPGDINAEKSFSDVKAGKYYTDAVDLMRKSCIINGDGNGRFRPSATAKRSEAAAMISRFTECRKVVESFPKKLPVITITTETGRDVESKEEYIRADFTLTGEDGRNITAPQMRIRGRGNQSWKVDKKSYRLKFNEDTCLMKDGETLNKDWTLIACHGDKSLIRNHMAQSLARALDGIAWAPYTELVEVYLNGEYRGVYTLCEQVEVADDRVEIEDGEKKGIGFLLELDGYAEGEYNHDFFAVEGVKYTVKSDFESDEQVIAMKLHLGCIMNIIKKGDFDKISEYVDLDSAVDMYLVYELMRNLDAGWSSFYMYFDEPHGKLFFGPPWDFDLSAGNSYNCDERTGLYVGHRQTTSGEYVSTTNPWFASLMVNEEFRTMVRDRWNEKKNELLDVVNTCCKEALVNAEQIERNFEAWDVLHVLINQEPANVLALKSYTDQVEYLGKWLLTRANWLDTYYNSDKFGAEYDYGEKPAYGVTETISADTWTVADWYEGDVMAQVYMDILYSGVETKDGRILVHLGLSKTVTPENFARRLLEEQLGAEKGRFTFIFDETEFSEMKVTYGGEGFGNSVLKQMTVKIRDLTTGEESLPARYDFHMVKHGDSDLN